MIENLLWIFVAAVVLGELCALGILIGERVHWWLKDYVSHWPED